jgi:hypothetical protein
MKWKVVYGLFARHSGTVDINSAKTGTSAWGDDGGGLFTRTLTYLFCVAPTDVGGTKDYAEGYVPWRVFMGFVENQLKDNYKKYKEESVGRQPPLDAASLAELKKQETQMPQIFALPPLKLGLRLAERIAPQGLVVTDVVAGLPADNSGIKRGDIVISLEGKPLNKEAEYADAVDSFSGKQMTFRVIQKSSGAVRDVVLVPEI